MKKRKQSQIMGLILLLMFARGPSALAQPELEYRDRGDRYEGIKPKPVAGYDIELISVLVNYREERKQTPNLFKVRFYLKQPSKVYLTVRELQYKYYYWMDRVKPSKPWRPGFGNLFEWTTEKVIQKLEGLRMYDLGVVARLGKPVPSKIEQVAPSIFYHSQLPSTIEGYLFTFKTTADARLTCKVFEQGKANPLFAQTFPRKRGGRAFTIRWDSSKAAEGPYKLIVTGYFLYTNDPIEQTVSFYHRPVVE